MPGAGSYGPGGKWIHDRAQRIMEGGDLAEKHGPEEGKSIAYALAVQQAHKTGKSPKDFRTPKGVREAEQKYDEPKSQYQKTASPAGQDLRAEFKGGVKFPTVDSTEHAQKLLRKSQAVSEVNATPMPVKMHTPSYGTTKGDLPTFKGASMDEKIKNDPLVQHLRKEAGLREELGADSVGMNPPQGDPDAARFSQALQESFNRHQDDTLTKLFSRASSARKHGLHNDKRGA